MGARSRIARPLNGEGYRQMCVRIMGAGVPTMAEAHEILTNLQILAE
jgi:hypothetical protein